MKPSTAAAITGFIAAPFMAVGLYEAIVKATLHAIIIHHEPPQPLKVLALIRAETLARLREEVSRIEYEAELEVLARQ